MTRRRILIIASACLLASLLTLAYLIRSPFEITRLRNSLIADTGEMSDFRWQPGSAPEDYAVETLAAPQAFSAVVSENQFDDASVPAFTRALTIARHLTGGDKTNGDPIQSGTLDAYQSIVNDNRGFCSDYTQAFNALAHAASIPVREWGMSFDGFSGNGHAFSEVFDRSLNKWVFIDTFYSLYAVNPATREPLSVMELREQVNRPEHQRTVEIVAVDQNAFAFKSSQQALSYYTDGKDQYYLWFGSNVFTYDDHPVVEFASRGGRAVEQAAAILAGVHPHIRIVPSVGSEPYSDRLSSIRHQFFIAFGLGVLATLLYLRTWWRWRRARRAI